MSDEMRRCPFCGERERLFNGYASGVRQCLVCGATALAKDWNTRPVEDELRAENARLQRRVDELYDEMMLQAGALGAARSRVERLREALGGLPLVCMGRRQHNIIPALQSALDEAVRRHEQLHPPLPPCGECRWCRARAALEETER